MNSINDIKPTRPVLDDGENVSLPHRLVVGKVPIQESVLATLRSPTDPQPFIEAYKPPVSQGVTEG